jgi:hypothetical protein
MAELTEALRKRLDDTSPRVLVDYLAERLGPAVAEELVGRVVAGETVPLPPDTRSIAEYPLTPHTIKARARPCSGPCSGLLAGLLAGKNASCPVELVRPIYSDVRVPKAARRGRDSFREIWYVPLILYNAYQMPRGRPSRQSVFDSLDRTLVELQTVGGLPRPEEAEEIWEGIWYEETHHSTAIEGNTLILKEVKALLEEGRAVGDKELVEYLEVTGYAEAATWVYRQALGHDFTGEAGAINLTELREIHRLVVEPAWKQAPPADHMEGEGPGSFRKHDINPFASGMTPPPWPDVPPFVTDWLAAANAPRHSGTHLMVRLADLHGSFERIHPFRDGNGRTGRLVLNLMLVRGGYPPAVIYKRDRAKYLRALARADAGDPGALAELLARAVKHGIDRFLLPGLAGPHRMIPLTALADNELSLLALRRAADRGRMRAQRRSDQWYSTKKWVDEYKAARYRRAASDADLEAEAGAAAAPANPQRAIITARAGMESGSSLGVERTFAIRNVGNAVALDLAVWLALDHEGEPAISPSSSVAEVGALMPGDPERRVVVQQAAPFLGGKVPRDGHLVGRWTEPEDDTEYVASISRAVVYV